MERLEHFKKNKEYAVLCITGQVSFNEVTELVSRAVLRCRKQNIKKLMVDSAGLTGFHPLGMSERYNFAERIASEARSLVKIAHVASPAWVRLGKFSLMVAKNRGLDIENFLSEPEALKWLLEERGRDQTISNPHCGRPPFGVPPMSESDDSGTRTTAR
jgi:hypothetical protein